MKFNRIIISRTDNIGDVVLTLPIVYFLKQTIPGVEILFIGKAYTKPVIAISRYVDQFLDREEIINEKISLKSLQADTIVFVFPDRGLAKLASKARIKLRIGTSHRWFHWIYCNKRINFSRKNSSLHESQLNFKLLTPLLSKEKIPEIYDIKKNYGIDKVRIKSLDIPFFSKEKINIVFHPKSKGSAREWPLNHYYELAKLLPEKKFSICITGTKEEGEKIKAEEKSFFDLPHLRDYTGKFSLDELISFINKADGLVACSTGPLHIAAALGKLAIGIFPPMKPIHPGRWKPLGEKAICLVKNKECSDCRKNIRCACIEAITPLNVYKKIQNHFQQSASSEKKHLS